MPTSARNQRWLARSALSVTLTLGFVASPLAQEAAQGAPEVAAGSAAPVITLEADAVLQRMQATFAGMKRYKLSAQITRDEVLPFGYKLQNNESAHMWVDAPARMRLEVTGDVKNRTYVYDGEKLTMSAPDLNVYADTPAPGTLKELVRLLLDAGVEMPLIDVLYEGTEGDLTADVRIGLVVGQVMIDGVLTDHLAFRQPDVDWQLWVDRGERALPRKLLITTRYAVGDPQYQALLKWDLNPRANAKTFAFAPPDGAAKIPFAKNLFTVGGDK